MSSAMQLGEATLARLDAEVRRPPMPRPPAGIVHLGLGAFHRAFRSEVLAALDRLTSLGVRATLAAELS